MRKILLLIIGITSMGCSQTNKKSNLKIKNKVLNLHNDIIKQDNCPSYMLNLNFKGCSVEILINDIPVFHSFYNTGSGGSGGDIHVNEYILTSGEQNISINIYPATNNKGVIASSLNPDLECKVQIDYGDFNKQKVKDFINVYKFEFNEKLAESSLPLLSINEKFNAQIPYKMVGWKESLNLKNENKEVLKKEVLDFYSSYIKVFKDKNIEEYAKLVLLREKDVMISNYLFKTEDSKLFWDNIESDINTIQNMSPIENYEMKFYGDGKVVSLVRIDNEFRGESVIIGETEDNYNFYPIYLHRPAPGAKLEVIR